MIVIIQPKKKKTKMEKLTLINFSLEWGMKTLLIAENQLPFFPMFLALLSLPENWKGHKFKLLSIWKCMKNHNCNILKSCSWGGCQVNDFPQSFNEPYLRCRAPKLPSNYMIHIEFLNLLSSFLFDILHKCDYVYVYTY